MDFAKNTLFKSYGVICSPQRTLTVLTARRYIRRTIGRLAAILTPSHTTTRNYCTGLASHSSSSVGVLATPLMHDVELNSDGITYK